MDSLIAGTHDAENPPPLQTNSLSTARKVFVRHDASNVQLLSVQIP